MTPPAGHWFEPIGETLGSAYLRYSFTRGTEQEVDALIDMLGLDTAHTILDVGCGPGRHSHELARRGYTVHGIDITQRFVDLAREHAPDGATFERADARTWRADEPFDVVIALCQGAFGLAGGPDSAGPDPDLDLLATVVANLRPGGRLALSAFSAYFQVRHLPEGDEFDAATAVHSEVMTIKDEDGNDHRARGYTTVMTPRELRLMADAVGLDVDGVYSVRPGRYGPHPPTIETEEFLLLATRRGGFSE